MTHKINWWGKILGGAFGIMLGSPIGILLGVVLGHNFDKALSQTRHTDRFNRQQRIQTIFYTTVFSVMGHLCKADGRVSKDEIVLAQHIMRQMDLNDAQKKTAIDLFNEGRKPSFPLQDVMKQFRRELGYRTNLSRIFIEIQILAAYADGIMHQEEQNLLLELCQLLNISRHEFEHLCAMIGSINANESSQKQQETSLQQAYKILDIHKNADKDEIKRAYRRLMNQHHPDKLVAQGLAEEMIKIASNRTHEIKKAYDLIKKAKGF